MNTTQLTQPAPQAVVADASPTTAPDEPRPEPIWRVVGGSVAAGFIGALVLTLGVFGGAQEHVISGSALLAFALGWAMLAALSARFTSQPQRWARVPAAGMAASGLTLLIAQPTDHALTTAGWVWPPVAFALTVWTAVQIRRNLAGRVRWLLYPIVASLAVGSVGGMYETAVTARDEVADAAPGSLYDVGGHRLHLNCTGTSSPTVVLENGLGSTSPNWARVTADVGPTTRVCAYDRAGQGWSDDIGAPQDAVAIAADLHTLLDRAGESGPYVLAGHSAGGTYVMTFAARYPDEVAGMVLLDSMSPYEFTDLPGFTSEQSMMRRGLGVLPSLARLGATQVLPTSVWSSLPEPAASQVQAFASSPSRHAQHARRAIDVPHGFRTGQGVDVARRQAARRRHRNRIDRSAQGVDRPAGPPGSTVDQQSAPSRRLDAPGPDRGCRELRGLRRGHPRRRPVGPDPATRHRQVTSPRITQPPKGTQ